MGLLSKVSIFKIAGHKSENIPAQKYNFTVHTDGEQPADVFFQGVFANLPLARLQLTFNIVILAVKGHI